MGFVRKIQFLLVFATMGFAVAGEPSLDELQRKAVAGDAWAQLNLGAAYDHGQLGLQPDPVIAVGWYRKAALQGVVEAEFNLAHCLATGHGVTQDYAKARHWMAKAASQGLADAQFLLAVMLDQGLGGDSDPVGVAHWLGLAQKQGHAEALQYIKKN